VFDNLRYISGNVLEQRRVPSRCVTTAVKDIRINIQHQRNLTMTAEKRLRNDRCTPASHFRPDGIRNRLQESGIKSTTTLCGSAFTPRHRLVRQQWCKNHRSWTQHQWAGVNFSYVFVTILYNHRTYTRWKLHFFRSGITSLC